MVRRYERKGTRDPQYRYLGTDTLDAIPGDWERKLLAKQQRILSFFLFIIVPYSSNFYHLAFSDLV